MKPSDCPSEKCYRALLPASLLALFTSMTHADMLELSLEQLMDMDVTVSSASKSDEKVIDVPSAIYVISHEDIRRAGISSVPEALRMAPGLHVAQINTNEWAVSARGLNGRFSRYLLVLIDGRSIYSSMFSGVNWDEHNLIMNDIERIEVIRGPGASVWGANAVNGVINIITRAPDPEAKNLVTLRGGKGEKAHVSGATSGQWGELDYRLSGQHAIDEGLYSPTLSVSEDDGNNTRISWQGLIAQEDQSLKLYADLSHSNNFAFWPFITPGSPAIEYVDPKEEKKQYSLQARWKTQLNENDALELRVSNDQTQRKSDFWDWTTRNTDAELLWSRQVSKGQIHLGFNYRWTHSHFVPGALLQANITPEQDNIELYSTFGQLQYQLTENIELTLGAKYESHSETGDNIQPSARAIWSITESQRFWLAASKAISTPSRTITNISRINIGTLSPSELPPELSAALMSFGLGGLPVNISAENRGETIDNTELVAFEAGYRFQWSDSFSVELAAFDNEYTNLVSTTQLIPDVEFNPGPYVNIPIQYLDDGTANARGVELNSSWKVTDTWLLEYSGSYINFDPAGGLAGGVDLLDRLSISEDTPTSQHSLRSFHNLSDKLSLDVWVYHYGEMKRSNVDDFTSANVRLEWKPTDTLSLALIGKNLLDSNRNEFYREIFFTGEFSVQQTINLEAQWSFD